MIFETLAAMADRADDDKDNYSSDFNQAKRVLDDVDNDGLNGQRNHLYVVKGNQLVIRGIINMRKRP